ncbi:MAG: hypothetical protein IKI88_03870, partial [Anaerotignum sp.]|nr:hypothetical protein [Anaerotignum sp.]
CFVGDLEPFEYIEVYEENEKLKSDWEHILSFQPKRVFYSHRPERVLDNCPRADHRANSRQESEQG